MTWWIWLLIGVYVAVFLLIFISHLMYLQMVTPALAFWRALLWPLWIVIGFPRGVPLTMD